MIALNSGKLVFPLEFVWPSKRLGSFGDELFSLTSKIGVERDATITIKLFKLPKGINTRHVLLKFVCEN